MKSTTSLPQGYQPIKTLSLSENKKTLLILNLIGLFIFVAFGWLFIQLTRWLHPDIAAENYSFTINSSGGAFTAVVSLILLLAVMIVLHEGIHGVCFWMFTRARPKFAFKGAYAYATAPGWYIPRAPYLVTALAPFVVISVMCAALLIIAPPQWFFFITLFATMNAGGAVGDLIISYWLVQQPSTFLVLDQGDSATLYNQVPSPIEET